MEIRLHTKFLWDISVHVWDKTMSRFRKRRAAILEFYFCFRFWPMYRHVILHLQYWRNFIRIQRLATELWRHIDLYCTAWNASAD